MSRSSRSNERRMETAWAAKKNDGKVVFGLGKLARYLKFRSDQIEVVVTADTRGPMEQAAKAKRLVNTNTFRLHGFVFISSQGVLGDIVFA